MIALGQRYRNLLLLQLIYAGTGSLFNFISLVRIAIGDTPLTQTNPAIGILVMSCIAGAASAGLFGFVKTFTVCNLILIPPLLFGGIVPHVLASAHQIGSTLLIPLVVAVGINIFGVVVMTLGLVSAMVALLRNFLSKT